MSPAPNEIEEAPGHFILWKNPDLPPTDEHPMSFKDMWIGWGQAGERVKIRQLVYPKASYTREEVERIAQATLTCPNCTEGRTVCPHCTEHADLQPPQTMLRSELASFGNSLKKEWDDFWRLLF